VGPTNDLWDRVSWFEITAPPFIQFASAFKQSVGATILHAIDVTTITIDRVRYRVIEIANSFVRILHGKCEPIAERSHLPPRIHMAVQGHGHGHP
jgi:hypothetical protein